MKKSRCLFCEISKKNKEFIEFENEHFYVVFDRFPVSPGHALIIPKRHVVSVLELNQKEQKAFWKVLKKTIQLIEKKDLKKLYESFITNPLNEKSEWFCRKMLKHEKLGKKPDGYNIGLNEGEAAGRTIHHLHIHVIPRYSGDVKDPTGGIRNIIPKLGNYKQK